MLGVRLAGETQALSWLKDAMAEDTLDSTQIRWAVALIRVAPGKLPVRSRIVCKCADVTEAQILTALKEGAMPGSAQGMKLAALQEKMKCGTFCGSCVPKLKQMLAGRTLVPLAA